MNRAIVTAFGLARGAVVLVTGYLGLLTVSAVIARPRNQRSDFEEPVHRFSVLIPAHDEAEVIAEALESITRLDYPDRLFSVHVVADNCTDSTADIARAAGFDVHERAEPAEPGKGPALQWLLSRLPGDRPDVVVFVDADTTVSPQFLRAIDDRLRRGAQVVQGHYAVRDPGSSPVVAFRAAAFAAKTYLRPLGRSAIGGSAGLHGNGMAFRADVMAQRRWSDHLTEDVELHLDLLLDGTLVEFAPLATIAAEMPSTLEASKTQHERWERGRIEIARHYVPRLVRSAVAGGPARRVAYVDAALDQLVPPLSVLVAGSSAWGAITLARAVVSGSPGRRRDLALVSGVLATQVGHVFAALALVGAPAPVYRALLQAPRMIGWKVALWTRVLLRPTGVSWARTTRTARTARTG